MPDHIDAEAVDSAAEPEPHDIVHRGSYLRIAPFEIGLSSKKRVIIILTAYGIIFPGAAAEVGQPVVGGAAFASRITPDVPVPLGTRFRGATFLEPRMLVRRVVRDEVKNNLEIHRMGGSKDFVEVR